MTNRRTKKRNKAAHYIQNVDQNNQNSMLHENNAQHLEKIDQNSWKTLISFLNKKEVARLCQTSKSNNTSIKSTPYGVIERVKQTPYTLVKSSLTFHNVASLNRRAKELQLLLNLKPQPTLRRIADLTPNSHQEAYSSMLLFVLNTKTGLANLTPNTPQETILFISLTLLGLYASTYLSSTCNNITYGLIGGTLIGDLIGGTLCAIPTGMLGMATGMYLGGTSSKILRSFSEHGGMCIGGVTGGLIGLSSGIYYGIEKIVTDFPPAQVIRTISGNPLIPLAAVGATLLGMFGIYKNKVFFTSAEIESKAIKNDLRNFKRL
jgi:hypothetical protein